MLNAAALLLAATLSVEDYAVMPQVAAPHWSPEGGRIAYVVTKADLARSVYDSDLWIIDADGKNDRRLTFANGADFRPRWSPDGARIAFLSDRGGRNAIYILDASGGETRGLTSEPTPIREFEWSPDGKQIAFTRIDEATVEDEKRVAAKDDARVVDEGTRLVQLYLADAETGKSKKLTTGPLSTFDLDWSPDGSQIVVSRSKGTGLDGLHSTDLYLISVSDGEIRPLVVRPGHDRNPRCSPDGQWVAFTSAGGVGHWLVEFDIHVVPVAGGEPRRISAAYDRTPDGHDWTEDGRGLWIEGPGTRARGCSGSTRMAADSRTRCRTEARSVTRTFIRSASPTSASR